MRRSHRFSLGGNALKLDLLTRRWCKVCPCLKLKSYLKSSANSLSVSEIKTKWYPCVYNEASLFCKRLMKCRDNLRINWRRTEVTVASSTAISFAGSESFLLTGGGGGGKKAKLALKIKFFTLKIPSVIFEKIKYLLY